MDKYFILPRFQFTSLYKYGEIYVHSENLVSADLPEVALVSKLTNILIKLPYFEYDDEYIILGASTEPSESNPIKISIDQIDEVIALSQQAKISIESKVDRRINIELTNWSQSILKNIEDYYQKQVIEKGIDAIWKISGFDGDWRKLDFLPPNVMDDLVLGIKERAIVKSKDRQQRNILIQALVYDRTEFFPEGNDGYLFDVLEILCNYLKINFQFKHTDLYPWLLEKHINGKANCWLVYTDDISNINLKNIKAKLVENYPSSIKWENTLAWYIAQKESIREKGQFDSQQFTTDLKKGLKEFEVERKMAVILLGAFFGYKTFYDAFYNEISLKFFKKPVILSKYSKPDKGSEQGDEKDIKDDNTGSIKHPFDQLITENKIQEYSAKKESSKNKPIVKLAGKSKVEEMGELQFDAGNQTEIKENPTPTDEISLDEVRTDQDDNQKSIEKNSEIKEKISNIVTSVFGLKAKQDIINWILICFEKYKDLGVQNQEQLLSILLSPEKPKGFGEEKAKQIIEAFIKDDLL